MDKNTPQYCFFISSVTTPWDNTPYNYSMRSSYTPTERTLQTIKTIESIRKYCPQAQIILCEGGSTSSLQIARLVDKYIYAGKYHCVRYAVAGNSKAYGEAMLTLCALPFISNYDYIWKISGRYFLNDKFDINKYVTGTGKNRITGKDIYGDKTQISTRLLGIPKSCIGLFVKAIFRRFWKLPRPYTVYEAYLMKGIGIQNINFIIPIGVEGFLAGTKEMMYE